MEIRIGPTGQRFDFVARTSRVHDPTTREVLRRAGLSMESELDEAQRRVLAEYVEAYADDIGSVPGHLVRTALLPSLRGEGPDAIRDANLPSTNEKGELIMAKATKRSGRKAKSAPSKSVIAKI